MAILSDLRTEARCLVGTPSDQDVMDMEDLSMTLLLDWTSLKSVKVAWDELSSTTNDDSRVMVEDFQHQVDRMFGDLDATRALRKSRREREAAETHKRLQQEEEEEARALQEEEEDEDGEAASKKKKKRKRASNEMSTSIEDEERAKRPRKIRSSAGSGA